LFVNCALIAGYPADFDSKPCRNLFRRVGVASRRVTRHTVRVLSAPTSPDSVGRADPAGVSVADAARRIGVATSTLRTWERRYGLQPSARTAGGHRRYTAADVAALQRLRQLVDSGMPTASAAALAADVASDRPAPAARVAGPDKQAHRFAVAVERLDAAAAASAAAKIIDRVGVVAAWTDIFTPHLQAAGEHWESTGLGVEKEHFGAAAIRAAMNRYTLRRAEQSGRPRLLAAATPTEAHSLPLDALGAALAEHRVGSVVLEMLPPEALRAAIQEVGPAVLVLWARSRDTADDSLLRSVLNLVPFVCAAGPGWQPRKLNRSVIHLTDLAGAVDTVRAWTA
jgi:MerR family transcriptional regulator, light-induced transcriptional regulator